MKYCGTVYAAPLITVAGQTPRNPRQPESIVTMMNGIENEKAARSAATVADSDRMFKSVTCCSVVSGMPSDPNATGAVLATNAKSRRLQRGKSHLNENGRRNGHRRAEAGHSLQKRSESESD